jgi:subtilisin family serine protease
MTIKNVLLGAAICLLPALSHAQDSTQWYLLDSKTDNTPGIGVERAYRELLKGRKPTPVLVAVIDGGIDTAHADLRRVLWTNKKEIAGNGLDDDGNGYADDLHGWNFIGGKDGRNVGYETVEITREYARLKPLYEGKVRASLKPEQQKEFDFYQKAKGEVEKNQAKYTQEYEQIGQFFGQFKMGTAALKAGLNVPALDSATLHNPPTTDPQLKSMASQIYRIVKLQNSASAEAITDELAEYVDQLKGRAEFQYNPNFDGRAVVGDHINDVNERLYGNADMNGPRADHGTHVAGIIGADRTNNLGVLGIADAVQIMGVRAVPDGDERDKDVANAIRYAVDNGAQIINMSFGKDYSPQQKAVEEAVRYALSKKVLLVHAAGNDGKNLDTTKNYPDVRFMDGSPIPNLITVGASARTNDKKLIASFSNYGKQSVDVFAPGNDIYATVPGSKYKNNSGTSMASPVVAGVAALLKSYFPKLTATDLKRIIETSATVYHTPVTRPESGPVVDFSTLSRTGGIVNVYEAVKMALAEESRK